MKVEPVGEFELKGSGGLWRRTMWLPLFRKKLLVASSILADSRDVFQPHCVFTSVRVMGY